MIDLRFKQEISEKTYTDVKTVGEMTSPIKKNRIVITILLMLLPLILAASVSAVGAEVRFVASGRFGAAFANDLTLALNPQSLAIPAILGIQLELSWVILLVGQVYPVDSGSWNILFGRSGDSG